VLFERPCILDGRGLRTTRSAEYVYTLLLLLLLKSVEFDDDVAL